MVVAMAAALFTPYNIDVPAEAIVDLRSRLARTRWPRQLPAPPWTAGVPVDYLRMLIQRWHDDYHWPIWQAALNVYPQSRTVIEGQTIHFLHVRSPHADALPLLVIHGWPGSIAEFLEILGPLTDPTAHGGDARDAFHVVAPSVPGHASRSRSTPRAGTMNASRQPSPNSCTDSATRATAPTVATPDRRSRPSSRTTPRKP
jgi:hypothetical protein